ncbi:class II fumarate hydratase [Apilactobacillus timberlakei]|uniref:class II fumarate hydratase n=1 Tax=Apilactobacillus timberlakei TaxID=2008380 RepID=UPI00112833BF|nr:class II fumarate hydratase [Apilactobacillus timberlakei]TPR18049.1 class II fumarate hydratase [Apilactobacillus timberlakei]TPR19851.1 class II fumarate hydratase [Apilactobacillus timberlakei]TPR21389.1 class II fumarate hydratase [Apilactobacillus timberlakei]
MEYRIEKDSLGNVKVPKNALFGPQTQRSRTNFKFGRLMPIQIIHALLQIKKAAAIVNAKDKNLDQNKSTMIVKTINQILDGNYRDEFPLHVYQTGSGTQTNMNVNEVVSHLAQKLNSDIKIHPNDDVNKAQSSNDTFPTAMMIAATDAINNLLPVLKELVNKLNEKEIEYQTVVKIGRTHLQDATPITFGQEISGWKSAIQHDIDFLIANKAALLELPIGGTAVGTGLNTPDNFDLDMVNQLNKQLNEDFKVAPNKFQGLANHSGITMMHGILKTLATDLIKIGNDIRFLASGPRAGYNELNIPSNEPGSSIMPGKVNPTQIEALTMVSAEVMGNDTTINFANSQGNFEMNVYKPLIISKFLESANLLSESVKSFTDKLVDGMTINKARMDELLQNSLMLVTALSPHIGYERSAKIAQKAKKENTTLKEAALASGVDEQEFKKWVVARDMTNIDK